MAATANYAPNILDMTVEVVTTSMASKQAFAQPNFFRAIGVRWLRPEILEKFDQMWFSRKMSDQTLNPWSNIHESEPLPMLVEMKTHSK